MQWHAYLLSLKVKSDEEMPKHRNRYRRKKLQASSLNRNTTTCQHSRAAERIDPVNPAAAMNAHVSAVLCNTLERVGGVCTTRMVGEVRDNVESRWVRERNGEIVAGARARGGKRAQYREREGSVALWIRHYSPRLLLPTYRPSLLSKYARDARTSRRIRACART